LASYSWFKPGLAVAKTQFLLNPGITFNLALPLVYSSFQKPGVIVGKCVFICFLLYIFYRQPPDVVGPGGNFPLLSLDGPESVNNVLINVFKKLTQRVNALKN